MLALAARLVSTSFLCTSMAAMSSPFCSKVTHEAVVVSAACFAGLGPLSKLADRVSLFYASRQGCCGQPGVAQPLLQGLAATVLHL